jgi:hypothetical protein
VDLNTLAPAGGEAAPAGGSGEGAVDGAALQQACEAIFLSSRLEEASPWLLLLLMFPSLEPQISRLGYLAPGAKLATDLAARKQLAGLGRQLVEGWREAQAAGGGGEGGGGEGGGGGGRRGAVAPGSFLGLLLEARDRESGQRLSDIEVRERPEPGLGLLERGGDGESRGGWVVGVSRTVWTGWLAC